MLCLSGLFVLLLARSLVLAGPLDLKNGKPLGPTARKPGDVVMVKPGELKPPIQDLDGVSILLNVLVLACG